MPLVLHVLKERKKLERWKTARFGPYRAVARLNRTE